MDKLQQRIEVYDFLSKSVHAHRELQEKLAAYVDDLVGGTPAQAHRARAASGRLRRCGPVARCRPAEREAHARGQGVRAAKRACGPRARAEPPLTTRGGSHRHADRAADARNRAQAPQRGDGHDRALLAAARGGPAEVRARRPRGETRDRGALIDKLLAENRDLVVQLAAQTQSQALSNIAEKLDAVMGSME